MSIPFTPIQVYKYAQDNLPAMLSADDLVETTGLGYFLFPYFFGEVASAYIPAPEVALRELLMIKKELKELHGTVTTILRQRHAQNKR